jgi:signal transduction histidine kinase
VIRVDLARPFARRLIPLVLISSGLFAAAVPLAFHLEGRRELATSARAEAGQVARVVELAMSARPLLWRYDATKLAEQLQVAGLGNLDGLEVQDAAGRRVALGGLPRGPVVWGRADVVLEHQRLASVWVASRLGPLWTSSGVVAILCAVLALVLGSALYLYPVRTVTRAETRIAALLAERRVALQEEERRRIARDLHDGAGQAITAARLQLLALRRQGLPALSAAAVERHLDEALEEVRRSTSALLPAPLAELGLLGALERHCATYAQATGVDIALEAPGFFPELPEALQTAVYRIAQEALHNTIRHASASRAVVRLQADARMVALEVDDDGRGFGEAATCQSIRERVAGLGGAVTWPEMGSARLRITLPLAGGDA